MNRCCPTCDAIIRTWAEREARREARRSEALRHLAILSVIVLVMAANAVADWLPA